MDIHSLSHYAPLAIAVAIGALLFVAARLFARRRRAAPAVIASGRTKTMLPLFDAATAAYEAAKRERMAIATVADAADGVGWFAQSIASVVAVYRMDDGAAFQRLEVPRGGGTDLQALYIRKRDYQTYIGWARSMQ